MLIISIFLFSHNVFYAFKYKSHRKSHTRIELVSENGINSDKSEMWLFGEEFSSAICGD